MNKIKEFFGKLKSYKADTYMMLVTIFYAMGSILINLMAVKTLGWYDIIDFDNGHFGNAILPITTAGSIISWLVFAAIDIITEVSGKKKAIQVFWMVGILNVILTVIAALVCFIPGNPWTKDAYDGVFGGNWGIAVASITAFLIGNYVNAIIMYVMKTRASDPHSGIGFTFRVIVSTLIGQFLDNAIFYILALAPRFGLGGFVNEAVRCANWAQLFTIVGFTTAIELFVEVAFTPLFHKFSQFVIKKKVEEENKVEITG